jgi:1,2-diacylglycerol 3-alpha-glucosyltransferase
MIHPAPIDNLPRRRVAMIQHFWTHYRVPIVKLLLDRNVHDYTFLGDTVDPDGTIKPGELPTNAAFIRTRSRSFFRSRFLWQSGVIGAAMSSKYDVLCFVGHFGHLSTWIASALGRLRGKRVLFWTHAYTRRDRGVKALVRRTFYSLANGLLCYGHFGKSLAINAGLRPERLYVMYNSLDFSKQHEAEAGVTRAELEQLRVQLFGDPAVPVVICVIRLLPSRRLDMVIDAIARLRTQGHAVNALFVGDGPARESLEAKVNRLGVGDSVKFFGACYDERQLARINLMANATVCPGPIGLTAVQSLAFGTPVITNDDYPNQMPEFETILDDVTGTFFHAGDIDALACAIERWTRTRWTDDATRLKCRWIIERLWNLPMQARVIERASGGVPADDLFWTRG